MTYGQRFCFVVDAAVAGRMDRVILISDGKIIDKKIGLQGTIYDVEKL